MNIQAEHTEGGEVTRLQTETDHYFVCFDIGATNTRAGLVKLSSLEKVELQVVDRASTPELLDAAGAEEGFEVWFVDQVKALSAHAGIEPSELAAISIASTGSPDPATGTIQTASAIIPDYRNHNLRESLREVFLIPSFAIGDCQALALAEACVGAGKGVINLLLAAPGTGLGGGLVINGELLTGAHGLAGNLGHMFFMGEREAICSCGSHEHAEPHVAGSFLGEIYQLKGGSRERSDGHPLTGKDIADFAAAGDAAAKKAVRLSGEALGKTLASAANLVDPDAIVLAGSVTKLGEPWLTPLRDAYRSLALPQLRDIPITPGKLDDAPLIGAAIHAAKQQGLFS